MFMNKGISMPGHQELLKPTFILIIRKKITFRKAGWFQHRQLPHFRKMNIVA